MLEKEPARSAVAKPQKAETTKSAKTTAAKPATRSDGSRPAAARRRTENVHEHIQRRAYELWESEGRPAGREHAHWLRAESEVTRARTHNVGMSR